MPRQRIEDYAKGVLIKQDGDYFQAVRLGSVPQIIVKVIEQYPSGITAVDIAKITGRSLGTIKTSLVGLSTNKLVKRFRANIKNSSYLYFSVKHQTVNFKMNEDVNNDNQRKI